jgi:hypothetical protein
MEDRRLPSLLLLAGDAVSKLELEICRRRDGEEKK